MQDLSSSSIRFKGSVATIETVVCSIKQTNGMPRDWLESCEPGGLLFEGSGHRNSVALKEVTQIIKIVFLNKSIGSICIFDI